VIAAFYKYGRLGNRLFVFSNLVAFSELYSVPLLVPAFDEYRANFAALEGGHSCRYGFAADPAARVPSLPLIRAGARLGLVPTVRFWEKREVYFDAEDSSDPRVRKMREASAVVFEGWNFRSRRAISDFRPRIRALFAPTSAISAGVQRRMAEMRKRGDVLVGVHIRWGDYRGTDWYFELSEYVQRMDELRALLRPSNPVFLVFSPESIPGGGLAEDCVVCSGKDPVEDMYCLAECDYLVGPPSTFSMWASYYGGRPLFVMAKGRRFSELSDARVATP